MLTKNGEAMRKTVPRNDILESRVLTVKEYKDTYYHKANAEDCKKNL